MEPILKLVGTEIYILGQLQSSGLEGPAWASEVRRAEELERKIKARILEERKDVASDIKFNLEMQIDDVVQTAISDYL